jgi:prepilin-type N-terminal cleavage/methylation domain-containing protein
MIKGFSLVEVLVVLALTSILIPMVIGNVTASSRCSHKIIDSQKRMESIFHTVDAIKSDLTKCGMRLQEAANTFGFPMFEHTTSSIKVLYGVGEETLTAECKEGEMQISVNRNDFFSKRKGILIYDTEMGCYEFNIIKKWDGDHLVLSRDLQNDYSENATAVVVKQVEYKIYPNQSALKRKVNSGYFQPMLEKVTDFNVTYFPEAISVLYRIEIDKKEQIRGYIFLVNMVAK